MPQGDRTGPVGAGPRTGRSLGYCGGHDAPGYTRAGGGGRGWFRGGGVPRRHRLFAAGPSGWGHFPYASPTREESLPDFKAEAEWLKDRLEVVNKRIEELEE
jgi:hypothetical protein